MKRRLALSLFALALTTSVAAAQTNLLSVTISPNPAPLGTDVTFTAADLTTMNLHSPGGSLLGGVYDAPNGNLLLPFAGILLPQPIPTCASGGNRMQTVQGSSLSTLGAGTFWAGIPSSPGPFGPLTTEWFCFTIEATAGSTPTLSEVAPATIGQPWMLNIDNAEGMALYVVALSNTTNTAPGASLGLCLDFDPLFNLSLMGLPGIFNNFVGGTDATGSASGISIDFTNFPPSLACFTAHVQAGVLGTGAPAFTNDLIFTL